MAATNREIDIQLRHSVIFVTSRNRILPLRYALLENASKLTCDQAVFLPFLLEARRKEPFFTFAVRPPTFAQLWNDWTSEYHPRKIAQ